MSKNDDKTVTDNWIPPMEDSELVIGLVAPVGTELDVIINKLTSRLEIAKYKVEHIHVSKDVIPLVASQSKQEPESLFDIAKSKMDDGNSARNNSGDNAILALGVASLIFNLRLRDDTDLPKAAGKVAYIIRSLKHPEEVERLREIYPQGFYLLGIHADEKRRKNYLRDTRRMSENEAVGLMSRDEDEHLSHGQRVSDTFHMADFFVRLDNNSEQLAQSINRIIDIVFGYPFQTPTFDEYSMFLAFAASLRSADLARQVGAVIAREDFNEVLSTGANDCPRPSGGLYWPISKDGVVEDEPNGRDYIRGKDPNAAERNRIIDKICSTAPDYKLDSGRLRELLCNSPFQDITEYGRSVHAEMEAILACARNRVSTRRATLYSTTFPCHNCAKHIIAAGIMRVVYVEPYTKSKALELHNDAIVAGFDGDRSMGSNKRVRLEPFVGIGPRRFFDLFSMRLGSGRPILRKNDVGKVEKWQLETGCLRRQMLPYSYIDLETAAARHFDKLRNYGGGS